MDHVDLVTNNWMSGDQSWLARVIAIDGGTVKVEAVDSAWESRLQEPIALAGGKTVTTEDSKAYLKALTRKYQGSHVVATKIHDDAHCDFDPDVRRPMTKVSANEVPDHVGLWDRLKLLPGHLASETKTHLPGGSS